jgi:hypothetical protein
MTVAVNDTIERYVITGVGPYPFSWRIFNDTDLQVYVLSTATPPAPTLLTYLAHYTVAGANDAAGGSITLTAAALTAYTGFTIDIRANTPRNQPTSIRNQARFLPEIHEDAFDYLDRQIQDMGRLADASVRSPDNEPALPMILPPVASRAGKYLAFDSGGQPTGSSGTGNDSALRSDLASTVSGGNRLVAYLKIAAETTAGVTIVNAFYPPLCVNRYGTNTTPLTTDMRGAWQAAINVAKVSGGKITWDSSSGPHLITGQLDCTNPVGGTNKSYFFSGEGRTMAATTNAPDNPDVVFSHTGTACFDCTGTLSVYFENMSIGTTIAGYPQILFLMARNSDARSMYCRWTNVAVFGHFSKCIVYNYGMEEENYYGCQFFNRASDANASVFLFTATNIRAVASSFTTIAVGTQSTINHNVFGGSFSMFSNAADADVVKIEGGARFGRFYGPWMDCKNGTGAGRALFYFNSTNGSSDGWVIHGIDGEAAPTAAQFGVRFGGEAPQTYSKISVQDCSFPNTTNSISAAAGIILAGCRFEGIGNQSLGGGINILGTLIDSRHADINGGLTAGTYVSNNEIRRQGEAHLQLSDGSATSGRRSVRFRCVGGQFVLSAVDDAGVVYANLFSGTFNGTTVTAMNWGAATTASVFAGTHGFNGSAAIAKPVVSGAKAGNAALASLCSALASYGLITDSTT